MKQNIDGYSLLSPKYHLLSLLSLFFIIVQAYYFGVVTNNKVYEKVCASLWWTFFIQTHYECNSHSWLKQVAKPSSKAYLWNETVVEKKYVILLGGAKNYFKPSHEQILQTIYWKRKFCGLEFGEKG